MAEHVQGGAKLDGKYIPTKKALKDAIMANPAKVILVSISAFSAKEYIASDLPVDVIFNVCGPNPFTSRKWYASVQMTKKGPRVS